MCIASVDNEFFIYIKDINKIIAVKIIDIAEPYPMLNITNDSLNIVIANVSVVFAGPPLVTT